jgi:hypothetical protein
VAIDGSVLRCFAEVGHAAASAAPFARTIEALAEHTRAPAIEVVAFSAGAQIVGPALVKLATPRPGETGGLLRQRLRLSRVYFAAPDIDTRRFANELAQYIDIVGRVSIAANLNDSALRFSAVVNRASRAGGPNPTELDAEQTGLLVDASRRLGFDVIKVDPNAIPKLPPRSHANSCSLRRRRRRARGSQHQSAPVGDIRHQSARVGTGRHQSAPSGAVPRRPAPSRAVPRRPAPSRAVPRRGIVY